MGYDYNTAVSILTESEKNRMICAFLNTNQSNINWEGATKAFKSASVESFRRCISNSLKKIENAGGTDGEVATPGKGTPKSGGGKKRKAAENGDDGTDMTTPTKKKRGRKPKGVVAAASASASASASPSPAEDETKVKGEAVDEED